MKSKLMMAFFFIFSLLAQAESVESRVRFELKLRTAISHMQKIMDSGFVEELMINLKEKNLDVNFESEKVLQEVKRIRVRIEDSQQSFMHHSQSTWVETDLKPFAEIRMRPFSMTEKTEALNVRDLLFVLFHEMGHHLVGESESAAWLLAKEMIELMEKKIPVSEMLKISLGTFVGAQVGCRDSFRIEEIDLMKAKMEVSIKTTEGHCRIFKPFMNRYAFDSVSLSLQCQAHKEGTYCYATDLSHDFRMCKDSKNKMLESHDFQSLFLFQNSQNLKSIMSYCIFENKKVAVLNHVNSSYSFVGQIYGERMMSEESVKEFNRLETMWVGLSLFVKQAIDGKSFKQIFVDD
ncbi:MAG: hypothetical protein ACK5V3_09155 [Bdellovibrionales bacterium]